MIILGDAGFNYYGGWRDAFAKSGVSKLPITVFSIYGNHERRPVTIPSYHIAEWRGGKVYMEDEYPNLLFGIDGEVYDFDGKQTIVIDGAYSIDKEYRLAHGWAWWADYKWTKAQRPGWIVLRTGWIISNQIKPDGGK